jgi:hypothetical protein
MNRWDYFNLNGKFATSDGRIDTFYGALQHNTLLDGLPAAMPPQGPARASLSIAAPGRPS